LKPIVIFIPLFFLIASCNPFAPALDNSPADNEGLLGDQRYVDGVFQNLKYAYTLRDTSIYGQLFSGNFTFLYQDYDRGGVLVTWGRDEELHTSYNLFQNVQRLDLIWKDTSSTFVNPENTLSSISRGFDLTVTFNPSDKVFINGYAKITMERQQSKDPWMITQWRDESNF
jgi:hypothetical protein